MRTRSPRPTSSGCGRGERLAVEGEDVEVAHLVRVGALGADVELPLVGHQHEVAVDARAGRALRVDDQHADHAERDLRHLVVVRVVHERARRGAA
jgi:hypothetical protein